MWRHLRFLGLAVAGSLAIAAVPASAQGTTDPGDLVFWQSVQSSTRGAEFRAYLQAYPNGRFAELAKARIDALEGAGPAPAPGPTTRTAGPAPVPEPDAGPDPSIVISPRSGRVGQRFTITCVNFPQENSYDKLVVVHAGTPVMDPTRSAEQTKVLWSTYGNNCGDAGREAGPFAPGAYEVRWMSTLYNNDQPARYEMKAMTPFTIR